MFQDCTESVKSIYFRKKKHLVRDLSHVYVCILLIEQSNVPSEHSFIGVSLPLPFVLLGLPIFLKYNLWKNNFSYTLTGN